MANNNARLIEQTEQLLEVATTDSIPAVDLNLASKYSIQVVATVGDSIAHLEGSNDGINWTEIDDASIAEGANHIFEQPNVAYRYGRITLENDDSVDVSADCLILVIGDSI